jgi:hypothetical protein
MCIIGFCWALGETLICFVAAKYDVESNEDTPVAVKNKMNINFTLSLDERWATSFANVNFCTL